MFEKMRFGEQLGRQEAHEIGVGASEVARIPADRSVYLRYVR